MDSHLPYDTTPTAPPTFMVPVPRDVQLLQKTVDVLQNSTIAVQTPKDPLSKFWAAYKKVASEHDNEMLDRCNGNMDIVLIFAGLFSAINTAFIIALQPNPVDTSNTLLIDLIQITLNGASAISDQSATLSSFTGFSSNFWPQALAYVSLGFSLLAALGAVLGKQWLGYYKTKCFGRGSLEDRCKQRHRKFQKLEAWQFENVLQSFPVLLQISVLLFGLSLGAAMWMQQLTISIIIFVMTAFGALCHVFIVTVSLISPDCPFQTPVSLAMRTVFDHFRAGSQEFTSSASASLTSASTTSVSTTASSTALTPTASASTTSAMQWILETSTDPDILRSVVELLPTMPEQPSINIMVLCAQVRDMFKACFDNCGVPVVEDSALAYGKALFYFSSNYPNANYMLRRTTQNWNIWERWRILYLPWVLEECRISYHRMIKTRNETSKSQFQADTRTALRMAVAAGIDEFAHPDDPRLIWHGQFRFQAPLPDQFDWLMDCAAHFYTVGDIDVAGDALLLLIGNIKDLESSSLDQQRITPFLNIDKGQPGSHRLLHIALRAACHAVDYRQHLLCHADFSDAVLKAICPASLDVHNTDDLIINAINLLNLGNWPKGSNIAHLSLPSIQLLVLLVLPAPKITNTTMYAPWCCALIRCMGADQPYHFRHTAIVRIAEGAGKDLITAAGSRDLSLRNLVLSRLSPALFIAMSLSAKNDDIIYSYRDFQYIRLISTLAKSSDWHPSLIVDRHIEQCVTLLKARRHIFPTSYLHLVNIFFCIAPPGQAASYRDAIINSQWWELLKDAWNAVALCSDSDIEVLASVARATRIHMPQDLSRIDLQSFEDSLGDAVDWLSGRPEADENVVSAVKSLRGMVHRKCQEGAEESPVSEQLELGGYDSSPALSLLSRPRHRSRVVRFSSPASSSESVEVTPDNAEDQQVDMREFESILDCVPPGFVPLSFVPVSDDKESTSTSS